MKKYVKGLSVIKAAVMAGAALAATALEAAVTIVSPANGDTIATLTPTQAQYLAWSSAERYAKFTDPSYRTFVADTAIGASRPQPQTFRWSGGSGVSTVTVKRTSDSKVVFTTNQVAGTSVTIDNFEIGQSYTWTVSNAGGSASATFSTAAKAPRLLRDPDPDGRIKGVRDLGGRYGLDGRRVRQNLIFRSSRFNASSGSYITDANRSFWQDELAIKSDLDLRSETETGGITESPLGANINYFFKPGSSYDGMFTAEGIALFKAEFAPFLNAQYYPIVFHCVSGQDRTGCLAYILNGILGVREAELEKDYEATIFWNPDIPNFGFGHRDFDRFRAGLADYPGADVNAQCCYYVTNVCGFTSAQLTTLRDIMLEPYVTHTHTYGEWFVTANPTATAAGAKCRYCTVCDIVETAAISALASARDYLQLSAAGTLTTDYAPDADCRVLATYAASPGGKRTVVLTATRSGNVTSIALEAGKCYKVEIVRRDRDGEWRAVRAFVPAANGATATFYDAGKGTYASVQTSGTATLGDDGFASTDASFSLYPNPTSAGVAVVFTNGVASTLTVRGNYNLKRALVVGGGGAGGYKLGGGGGAGEMVEVTLATPIAYAAGNTIALTVGAGGLMAKDPGGKGGVSSVTLGSTTYQANGGGGGGDFDWDDPSVIAGRAGGSGGGGGGSSGSANAGGTVSKLGGGYGNAGGKSVAGEKTGGGGGGGAGGTGGTSTATKGGAGGAGRANNITGTSRYYAAGGAGGSPTYGQTAQGGSSIGGNGGSGKSSDDYTLPTAGAVGTGSGGGGGGYNLSGADGGSGTVILYFEPIVTQVTKPTLTTTTAVYDGQDHRPTITVTPAAAYTVTYSAEQWIAVGTYTATCKLTDTTQYVWKDGSTDDVVLTFTITAAPATQIDKPTLSETTAVYDGQDHRPTITVTPAGAYTVTYSAEQWIAVGTYTATCKLTDTTKYVWQGGSTDDVVLTFTITPAPQPPKELYVGTSTDASAYGIKTADGTYAVVFTNGVSATLTLSNDFRLVRALVVGGGGAGGTRNGGGGGAGEMVEVAFETPIAYAAGDTIATTVGAGGRGIKYGAGENGGNSSVTLDGTEYNAAGGGVGGNGDDEDISAGSSGGSGGGGARTKTGGVSAKLGSGYGNAGGASVSGVTEAKYAAGGGGGAGTAGADSDGTNVIGGAGGAGRANDITGASRFYAAGGGGGSRTKASPASGGSGIGGTGGAGSSDDHVDPTAGLDGTGSGGGGSANSSSLAGANGGSGTIILLFKEGAAPIELEKPTFEKTTAVYDGQDHKQTIWVKPVDAYTVTYSAPQWIEVGTYTATCKLTDTTKYVWQGGSTDDVVLTFTITPAPQPPKELYVGTSTDASAYGIKTADGTYAVVFTNGVSATLTLSNDFRLVRALVVGGGGAGGSRDGGGGGAGEMVEVSLSDPIAYVAGEAISLTVGAGGIGGARVVGGNGGTSTVTLNGTAYAANGGGGGGWCCSDDYDQCPGLAGGSGGGGARTYTGGNSVKTGSGYGNAGGACNANTKYAGGGGGGAGAKGADSDGTNVIGGAGGAGRANDITGTSRYYAAGGGGGSSTKASPAAGGSGIGGTGGAGSAADHVDPMAGLDGTGSGGGGAADYSGLAGGNGGSGTIILLFTANTPQPTPEPTEVPTIVWPNGNTVEILTPTQREFLAWSADMRREMFSNETYRAFICNPANGWSNPQPQTFRWTGDGVCTVTVERVSDSRTHFYATTTNSSVTVDNFEVNGSYRWTVANGLGSASATFTTEPGAPRLLHDPDPSCNIKGVRDLGGWIGLEGRRVRQNLLIRTSGLNRKTTAASTEVGESFITDANRAFWLDFLGIKSDLDFRSDEERMFLTASPLGPTVNFYPRDMASYDGLFGKDGPAMFKSGFDELLVPANYPIAFHCVAGQDRTGCFAYIVNGILGVDEDDLMKDWEATIFWNGAFPNPVSGGHKHIDTFRANLAKYPGANDNERCCYYVTNVCGYTYTQLETFRAFMLEGYEPKPEPPPETFDWLETDGKGWLLTDYVPNPAKSGLATEVRFLDMKPNHGLFHASELVMGATSVAGDFWAATCYPGSWIEFYTRSTAGFESIQFALGIDETNNYHKLVFVGNTAQYDGTVTNAAWTAKDVRVAGPLALFAGSYGTDLRVFPRLRCRGVQIWEVDGGETNLVHDYVPARSAAGVATLWDRVSWKFLTVKNGGVFTLGNDVAQPYYNERTGKTYATAQEALDDAGRGDVVVVTANPATPETVTLKPGVTVDTQGHANVTVAAPANWFTVEKAVGNSYIIVLNDQAKPTVQAEGETPAFVLDGTTVRIHAAPLCSNLWYGVGCSETVGGEYPVETWEQKGAGDSLDFTLENQTGTLRFYRVKVRDLEPLP